jgi:hypothetical protein
MKITRDLLKEMISKEMKMIRIDEMEDMEKMSAEEPGSGYEDTDSKGPAMSDEEIQAKIEKMKADLEQLEAAWASRK